MPKVYLTTKEAADALQVTAKTVRRMCAAGHISARKIGGERSQWRIPLAEIYPREEVINHATASVA